MASLTRLRFRDQDASNTYNVPINPHQIDNIDSDDYKLIEVIDSSSVRSEASFDRRERSLVWPAYEDSNTTFTAMVTELKTYKGALKQLNLQDVDYTSLGWHNIRVTDVQTVPLQGGVLRYTLVVKYVFTN